MRAVELNGGGLFPAQRLGARRAGRSLAGLGVLVGCAPFQLALRRLETAIDLAEKIGTSGAPIEAAKAFISQYGTFNLTVFYDDKACQTATLEAEAHIAAVGKLSGTSSLPGGPKLSDRPGDQSSTAELLSTIKTVAIAAGIVAGAVMLAPIITEAVGISKMLRTRSAR